MIPPLDELSLWEAARDITYPDALWHRLVARDETNDLDRLLFVVVVEDS